MNIKTIVLVISTLILSTSTNAAVVYDENFDGDINFNEFNFDFGSNTIAGVTSFVPGSYFDLDTFTFRIFEGAQISSFMVDFISSDSMISTNNFNLLNPGGFSTVLFDFTIGANSGSQIDLLALAGGALDPGMYSIEQIVNGSGSINYTYSAEVNAVPIPAAVWLFASGLIGLAGIARKREGV